MGALVGCRPGVSERSTAAVAAEAIGKRCCACSTAAEAAVVIGERSTAAEAAESIGAAVPTGVLAGEGLRGSTMLISHASASSVRSTETVL
jgi:hypothetical protein